MTKEETASCHWTDCEVLWKPQFILYSTPIHTPRYTHQQNSKVSEMITATLHFISGSIEYSAVTVVPCTKATYTQRIRKVCNESFNSHLLMQHTSHHIQQPAAKLYNISLWTILSISSPHLVNHARPICSPSALVWLGLAYSPVLLHALMSKLLM